MLPDYLSPGLDILFCGTAAGPTSARLGHYYAKAGNRFWRLLAQTGLTAREMRPDEDHLLPGLGLGFTDLAKGVAGMDHAIPREAFEPARVAELVALWRPKAVAFTSLAAARLATGDRHLGLGKIADAPWPGVVMWALSSPSGANVGFSAGSWHDLAAWRRGLSSHVG